MKKKFIGILICILFTAIMIQSVGAIPAKNPKPLGNETVRFKNCYIEANGLVDYMPPSNRPLMIRILFLKSPINNRFFGLYWLIIFQEPDVNVTIYSKENGQMLWHNEKSSGVWGFQLIRFKGYYTHFTDEDGFHVNIRGNAFRAIAAIGE